MIDGKEHVIAHGSQSLSKAERRYIVTRWELLAVVHFVKHYRHYRYGSHAVHHQNRPWLNFKELEGQFARWLECMISKSHTGLVDSSVVTTSHTKEKLSSVEVPTEEHSWLETKAVASLKEEQCQNPVLRKNFPVETEGRKTKVGANFSRIQGS